MKLLMIITLSLSLQTAFESGFTDPELLFPYTRAVQDTSSPVCTVNPALLPYSSGLIATAAGGKPYYGYGLDSACASAQYGGTGYGLSLRWNSFGDEAYRENSFSAGAAFSPIPWLGLGGTADLYRLAINCDGVNHSKTLYDLGAGLVFVPAAWLQAGIMMRNVNAFVKNQETLYGEWSCGLLASPCRGLSFSWNITDSAAGIINTLTCNVNPLKYISSGFGYSVETSSFGMNFGFMCGNVEFNYGLRLHPYLGYSHSVGITYSGRGVTQPLAYGKTGARPEKKINIQTATYEELLGCGILSDTSARRIILYREQIGPITREALARIGLTSDEIKQLAAIVYGFEKDTKPEPGDEKKKPEAKKKKNMPRRVVVKERFNEMISEGIPPYQAALYSDMCVSGQAEFTELISEDNSLSGEQKKIIRKICGR